MYAPGGTVLFGGLAVFLQGNHNHILARSTLIFKIICYFLIRFVILKLVPRDLIDQLPVPVQIQKYLNTPFYYSEDIVADEGEIQKIIKSEDEWIQEAATPRQ